MNGFLNVIKPSGLTASDVVVKVRKILNVKKVGHLGTLDPLAVGVLPVAVGKGTKLFNLLLNKQKAYRAFFRFGITTDTLDSDGIITETNDKVVTVDEVADVCKQMVGKQMQIPPAYSAKSVKGTRAYVLARNGNDVQLEPREIEIFKCELLKKVNFNTYMFDIVCSSGTYIRSIVRDMAKKMSTVGYMPALIRTESGMFSLEDALTLDEISLRKEKAILPIDFAISDIPRYEFDAEFCRKLDNGVKVPFECKDYRKIYCNGELFGIGKSKNGLLDLEYYLK